MKFLLFASTALALVKRQGHVLSADVAAIVTRVTALQTQVDHFHGAAQADALIAASEDVVAAIKKGVSDAMASPQLAENEAFALVPPLSNLIDVVNRTVSALITKKHVFAASGRGCEVYPQLVEQGTDAKAFSDALVSKVPASLKGIAGQISAPILQSLANGAAAFKDVKCAATTTGTQSSTTSTFSSTTSSASQMTTASSGTPTTTTTTTTTTASNGGDGGSSTLVSSSASKSATGPNTSYGSQTATTSGSATGTTEPCDTETGSKTHTGWATATATSSEPCDETTTVEAPVTETIPCTTTSQPTGGSGPQPSGGSGPHTTGGSASQHGGDSGSQPTGGSGCPGCALGETSPGSGSGSGSGPNPTTLVSVPSGDEGGNGGNQGNDGSGGSSGSPSPSSPVIVAGARRGDIPPAVAFAVIVGVVVGAVF